MEEQAKRPRRRRSLLLALLAILLILLCVLAIVILYPIIFPPEGPELTADAGGPYTVDEAQPLTLDGGGSTGSIVSYEWDFGDGTTGSGASPSHTYDDGPAEYTVTLTVTDDQGGTATDTAQVTVNNLPPTADADGPYTCQAGEAVTLSGVCTDPSPVDDAAVSCTWADFSGAAVTEPSYNCPDEPGEITVTLTATDKDGASAQDSTTISVTEISTLTADADGPYTGVVGEPVTFDGSGSSPAESIISYEWDFGDGETGSGVVISHTYAATGTYTVILTVADPNTQDTDTTTATITAAGENQPPTAVITTEEIPKAEPCLRFIGSDSTDPDGQIVLYEWDFGDGNTDTGEEIEYCYAEAGDYTVTLTVTDDAGATGSTSLDVTVSVGAEAE
jgi:PKD repeat protein